jgi:hypothetical protein
MNSRDTSSSGFRNSANAANRNSRSASGAASVEITGFPQALFVRTFGDPDTLFIPLLEATRDAFGLMGRLQGQGESQANAVSLCAMHLASSLLRDSQFSLGARGLSPENSYMVDFTNGTLHVNTRLYSVVNRRTSLFKVELAGNISGGPFVVRDPVHGAVIMQVEEEKLKQSNFFSSILPNECVRVQIDQERFGQVQNAEMAGAVGDLRLMIEVSGKKVPVIFRKKADANGWDILDGRQQEWVGSFSPEMTEHLDAVKRYVQELFNK